LWTVVRDAVNVGRVGTGMQTNVGGVAELAS
jgi:hypothetical protein